MQPDIDDICGALKDQQIFRKFAIKMEVRTINTMTALVARMCGYDANDEAGREKNWKRAEAIVVRAFSGKMQHVDDLEVVAAIDAEIGMARLALEPIQKRREEIETEMKRLAMMLPVASFIEKVAGFNAIGLAVIVGEAGNLSNYASKRKLWRRLGLGMAKGHEAKAYSTWRKEGGLTAEDWTVAGYAPRRLGQIVGVVTIPLAMWKSKNPYGAVYAARRARTMLTHPEWYHGKNGKLKLNKNGEPSSDHAKWDALRVMIKEFLSDLWSEWRRSADAVKARRKMADATDK